MGAVKCKILKAMLIAYKTLRTTKLKAQYPTTEYFTIYANRMGNGKETWSKSKIKHWRYSIMKHINIIYSIRKHGPWKMQKQHLVKCKLLLNGPKCFL